MPGGSRFDPLDHEGQRARSTAHMESRGHERGDPIGLALQERGRHQRLGYRNPQRLCHVVAMNADGELDLLAPPAKVGVAIGDVVGGGERWGEQSQRAGEQDRDALHCETVPARSNVSEDQVLSQSASLRSGQGSM